MRWDKKKWRIHILRNLSKFVGNLCQLRSA